MTADQKQTESATAENATAKNRGIKILKVYGIIYAVAIISYAVHCFTGSEGLKLSEIEPGRRVWHELTFEAGNDRIEIDSGSGLTDAVVEKFQQSNVARELGNDGTIDFYKKGFFHNIPWAEIFGILNFTGLVLLLYTALGDLLPKVLAEYSEKLNRDLSEARKAKAEEEALKQKYNDMLSEVASEKERLLSLVKEEAEHENKRIIEKTKDDIERIKQELQRHIEAELNESIEMLRSRIGREAIDSAREKLKGSASQSVHEALVSDLIDEMKGAEIK